MTPFTLTSFLIGTGCTLIIGACLGSIVIAILKMMNKADRHNEVDKEEKE